MEQRRTQRYKLELPLQIVQVGEHKVTRTEQTRDISSGGVSFLTGDGVDVGGRIEYIITLSGRVPSGSGSGGNTPSGGTPPVRIRCLGKVLRSQRAEGGGPYEVAVTMERYQFVRTDERDTN